MTSIEEPNVRQALHDLVDVPGPANLADQALHRAKRLRGRRTALGAAATLAVVGLVALPFVIRPAVQSGSDTGAAGTSAAGVTLSNGVVVQPCAPNPPRYIDRQGMKAVAEADWPQFVQIAIGKLPPRTDYTLRYGWGVCIEGDNPRASAVIDLGAAGEHGHLTLNLTGDAASMNTPTSCAGLPTQIPAEAQTPETIKIELLFCQEAAAGEPFVVGRRMGNVITVDAIYADQRAVSMRSLPADYYQPSEISAEALRAVVTDPALVDLIPVE